MLYNFIYFITQKYTQYHKETNIQSVHCTETINIMIYDEAPKSLLPLIV